MPAETVKSSPAEGLGSELESASGRKPSVLFVNQYFWPDVAATAQLLADLAEDLAEAGWSVSALSGRGSYVGADSGSLPRSETWRGVAIRRVRCTSLGRGAKWRRLLDYGSFLALASVALLWRKRPDLVVTLSTPPLVASLGLLARLRGSVFVYKVEDLYPDIGVALGVLGRRSLTTRVFARLSRRFLRRADTVVALDRAMAEALEERGARRTVVIPNWADGEAIRPDPESGIAHRRRLGLDPDAFVVLYAGNFGLAHRFDELATAAETLSRGSSPIVFLFVGGGPRYADVEKRCAGLDNCRFLPYQPREELGALYAAADLHVVSLRDEVTGLLVPSKYAACLAAGKPVLLLGGPQTVLFEEIEQNRVGYTCSHSSEALTERLLWASRHSEECRERGERARQHFDQRYCRRRATTNWRQLLERLLSERG